MKQLLIILLAILLVACNPPPAGTPTVRVIRSATKAPTAARAPTQTSTVTAVPSSTNEPTVTLTAEPTATSVMTDTPHAVTATPARATTTPLPATARPTSSNPQADARPCKAGQIKGNRNSMIYHMPGGEWYARTHNNVTCFNTEEEAQAAGFRRSKR